MPGVIYAPLGQRAGENTGSLISIDPATGAGDLIGPTGISGNYGGAAASLAITSTGEIFTSRIGRSPLYRVDALSGAATVVGYTGIGSPEGMACDMNDVLYSINFYGAFDIINKQTGAATPIGNVAVYTRGMAFDPTDNTLWVSAGGGQAQGGGGLRPVDAIYTIDVATAEATLVGRTGYVSIPGLVFDEDGNLFGVVGGGKRPNDLIAIDKTTGEGTVVGPVGFPAVSGLARRMPVPSGPQISLGAPSIHVGNTEIGKSVTRNVSISNYGSEDLTVSAISDPGAPFTLSELPVLPASIAQREAVSFTVTFSPVSPGAANVDLVIASNDADTPELTKKLVGRGIDFDSLGLAQPGISYATTGLEDGGRLLTIDRESGAGTLIGPSGLANAPGLAISSEGHLFATSVRVDGVMPSLYRLDAASGAEIRVGSLGLGFEYLEAIAFDGNDNLYGFGSVALYQINKETGATHEIISLPGGVTGMAFDPTKGILWVSIWNSDDIMTVDIATGDSTLVGATGLEGSTLDLFFDADGNLFGTKSDGEGSSDRLISIDKTTGVGTVIGDIGFTDVSGAAARLDRRTDPVSGVEDEINVLPLTFALAQNYPNPFNPSTTIRYELPKSIHVKLVVYDILGRTVRTLVNTEQTPGSKQTVWDGRNDAGVQVATGLYVYRIKAGDFVKARKLMLIK